MSPPHMNSYCGKYGQQSELFNNVGFNMAFRDWKENGCATYSRPIESTSCRSHVLGTSARLLLSRKPSILWFLDGESGFQMHEHRSKLFHNLEDKPRCHSRCLIEAQVAESMALFRMSCTSMASEVLRNGRPRTPGILCFKRSAKARIIKTRTYPGSDAKLPEPSKPPVGGICDVETPP